MVIEMNKPLTKSSDNKYLFGVCGGLSEYTGIDASLIRVLFVLGTFLTGSLIFLIYLILAFILPKADQKKV